MRTQAQGVTPADWSQFLPDLVATGVGAALAIVTALAVERWLARRRGDEERQQQRTWRSELIGMVRDELVRNAALIAEMRGQLHRSAGTDLRPVTTVWDSIPADVLRSTGSRRVPACYHDLLLVHRLVESYAGRLAGDGPGRLDAAENVLPALLRAIDAATDSCRGTVDSLELRLRLS